MDELTQAERKLIVQFQKWFETEGIEQKILELRKELDIPLGGLPITENDRKQIGSLLLIPDKLPPTDKKTILARQRGCTVRIRELFKDGMPVLGSLYFRFVLRAYIFFNRFLFDEVRASLPYTLRVRNLCNLEDAKESIEEYLGVDDDYDSELADMYINGRRELTNVFPIAINIHPEASQRDVVDFVKKNWIYIKHLQERQKSEHKKVLHSRTKINQPIRERNNLIYELCLQEKSTKEIRKELAQRNHFLDDGHILKVISLEKKKHEKK